MRDTKKYQIFCGEEHLATVYDEQYGEFMVMSLEGDEEFPEGSPYFCHEEPVITSLTEAKDYFSTRQVHYLDLLNIRTAFSETKSLLGASMWLTKECG